MPSCYPHCSSENFSRVSIAQDVSSTLRQSQTMRLSGAEQMEILEWLCRKWQRGIARTLSRLRRNRWTAP